MQSTSSFLSLLAREQANMPWMPSMKVQGEAPFFRHARMFALLAVMLPIQLLAGRVGKTIG
jgi:hypothetical protein